MFCSPDLHSLKKHHESIACAQSTRGVFCAPARHASQAGRSKSLSAEIAAKSNYNRYQWGFKMNETVMLHDNLAGQVVASLTTVLLLLAIGTIFKADVVLSGGGLTLLAEGPVAGTASQLGN